jgi:hypothetical protein
MKRKLIGEGWDGYRTKIIPKNAGQVQVEETRRAFYAGAVVLFQSLMDALDPERETTSEDLMQMQAIQDEIVEFLADLALYRGPS